MDPTILSPLINLGAVGVVAYLMIKQNKEHQAQMAKRLGNLEDELIKTINNNTAAMVGMRVTAQTLVASMIQRPCIKGDDAVKKLQDKHALDAAQACQT